jgi:Trypsin-like peptidase domain/TIR domain
VREVSLEDLLRLCTVQLRVSDGHGTGFFVAPGQILTCAHVVIGKRNLQKLTSNSCTDGEKTEFLEMSNRSIKVRWQDQENFAEVVIEKCLPEFDLALLRFEPPPNIELPCVHLELEWKTRSGDKLYLFGYPDEDFDDGCPATFDFEGLTGDRSPLLKFKQGQVRPGMSGAPLLNLNTGRVCGVVKFTRERCSDLGGGAIPMSTVRYQFPELVQLQEQYHQQNDRWKKLIKNGERSTDRVEVQMNFYAPVTGAVGKLDGNQIVNSTNLDPCDRAIELSNNQSASMTANLPIPVYLSCSNDRNDQKLRNELVEKYFSFFEKEGFIIIWHSGKVKPGSIESHETKLNLTKSKIFLILVSAAYISQCSDSIEYNLILKKYENEKQLIVPVILSRCLWEKTELGKFQPLPKNKRPITSEKWKREDAFGEIMEEFQDFLNIF